MGAGEIVYAGMTMTLCCIVNGLLMGEIINIVTSEDAHAAALARQVANAEIFGRQYNVDVDLLDELTDWIRTRKKEPNFDRAQLSDLLLMNNQLPRTFLTKLP